MQWNNPLFTPLLHITLHQCIIKLAPLQPLLVVSPGWCRHAAVGVQQDPEAPDQQEDQEEHEEAYEGQGSALLIVHPNQGQRGAAAATARAAGEWGAGRGQQQLVIKCGHIVHPPRGPKAGLTHWMDGWCIGRRYGERREGVHEVWCRRKGQNGVWLQGLIRRQLTRFILQTLFVGWTACDLKKKLGSLS